MDDKDLKQDQNAKANEGAIPSDTMQSEIDAGTEETNEEKLLKQVADLESQMTELKDKYLRLYAEFDNYKKRNAKEKLEWIQMAGKDVVISMLPVLDDLDRALKQIDESKDINAVVDGINLISSKFKNALESRGLKEMESIGQNFDPEFHEAITEVEAGEKNKGKVIDQIEKGYYLNEKIIRHAKVVVGK